MNLKSMLQQRSKATDRIFKKRRPLFRRNLKKYQSRAKRVEGDFTESYKLEDGRLLSRIPWKWRKGSRLQGRHNQKKLLAAGEAEATEARW